MSTYIIGDVQGCYDDLLSLLNHITFNPEKDRLGFVGDLVNRGPQSLDVLRFVKNLKDPLVVLGNHDMYALILGYDLAPAHNYDHTLQALCDAPDKLELLDWLRHQPLLQQINNTLLVHAGLPPQWSAEESLVHASTVHDALRGPDYKNTLIHLFGDEPRRWDSELTGMDRLRYIVNALVRMRYCDANGVLEFNKKEPPQRNTDQNQSVKPWFEWRGKKNHEPTILFGHWAALNGKCDIAHCHALDTGCVWGRSLTAFCLETQKRFSVPSTQQSI